MTGSKYLELLDERCHKFYEVEIDGRTVIMRWGRIGAEPRVHQVLADSERHARGIARARLDQKQRKGYRPATKGATAPQAVRPPEDARQLALELPTPPPRRRRRRQEQEHAQAADRPGAR